MPAAQDSDTWVGWAGPGSGPCKQAAGVEPGRPPRRGAAAERAGLLRSVEGGLLPSRSASSRSAAAVPPLPAGRRYGLSSDRGRRGRSRRAGGTGRARLAVIAGATRGWRHRHVPPGEGPPARRLWGRGGRSRRAGGTGAARQRRRRSWRHKHVPPDAGPGPGREIASRERHARGRARLGVAIATPGRLHWHTQRHGGLEAPSNVTAP